MSPGSTGVQRRNIAIHRGTIIPKRSVVADDARPSRVSELRAHFEAENARMRAVPLGQRYRFLCPLVVTEKPVAQPKGRKKAHEQAERLDLG
jgi:hypothetical protein